MSVLIGAAEATPDWLTEALRGAGAIDRQRIVAVEARANPAFNSSITHLALRYDADAPEAPSKLVLKLNRDAWGEAEVGLYRLAMAGPQPVPAMVPCYDAQYDPGTGVSHCLLLDISATHVAPMSRERAMALDGVPAEADLHAMVDALAEFHAYWWGHAGFGSGVLRPPTSFRDAAACAERIAQRQDQFRRFVDAVGSTVDPGIVRLCERALAGLPQLWADRYLGRFAEMHDAHSSGGVPCVPLTVVNGDCYFSQFLCPRDGSGEATYLVDFQEASVHLPAEDLVFMFATFWTRQQRREGDREMRLIRRYRDRLAGRGVTYDLDQLMDDYRVSIVYQLFRTIWDQTCGSGDAYWRPKLDCVVASYQDHGCAELTG